MADKEKTLSKEEEMAKASRMNMIRTYLPVVGLVAIFILFNFLTQIVNKITKSTNNWAQKEHFLTNLQKKMLKICIYVVFDLKLSKSMRG